MAEIHCYNKGCGQKYNPESNTDDSCKFHPGVPVFHDALKGWSCCKKRSTNFTEFLNTPGCTKGPHSNVKPVEPEKPEKLQQEFEDKVEITVEAPKQRDPIKERDLSVRPRVDEPMKKISTVVGSTLKSALDKLKPDDGIQAEAGKEVTSGEVTVGTSCKNNACKAIYKGEESNSETCFYHPGVPIFHEGMKYWTCCQKKTTDFDNFLAQKGCEMGKHLWIKLQTSSKEKKSCRYDWHQTGPIVCVSVFAKTAIPEKTLIEANKVCLKIYITFDGGKSVFENKIILRDVIDPDHSQVKMLGTKIEINLRKAEPFHWPSLEFPKTMSQDRSSDKDSVNSVE